MSVKELPAIEAPKTQDDSEGFSPIDLKTYKWEPGKTVRDQSSLVVVYDKDGRCFIGHNCDWVSFEKAFTITVVKPVTFDELRKLVDSAVRGFIKDNSLFDKDSNAPKEKIIKGLYKSLFVYWYSRLVGIGLTDAKSFAQAKEKFGNNGDSPISE